MSDLNTSKHEANIASTFNSSNASFIPFLDFSTSLNTAISLIIIVLCLAIIIFTYQFFTKKRNYYFSQEFWELRYSLNPKYMDWYTNFDYLNSNLQIEHIMTSNFPNKKKTKILELGCGNSTLAIDIKKLGYTNITSIDFSSVVIKQMKEKYADQDISFICADFNRLNETFKDNSFHIIIEKAGLDSIATKDCADAPLTLRRVYSQMYTVLKPGGIILSISIKNLKFWNTNVYDHLFKSHMFELINHSSTVFSTTKHPELMNLYFYYLKILKS